METSADVVLALDCTLPDMQRIELCLDSTEPPVLPPLHHKTLADAGPEADGQSPDHCKQLKITAAGDEQFAGTVNDGAAECKTWFRGQPRSHDLSHEAQQAMRCSGMSHFAVRNDDVTVVVFDDESASSPRSRYKMQKRQKLRQMLESIGSCKCCDWVNLILLLIFSASGFALMVMGSLHVLEWKWHDGKASLMLPSGLILFLIGNW